MRSEPSPLEAARAELAACEGDRQKFLRLLEQLQVHVPLRACMMLLMWPVCNPLPGACIRMHL